MIDLIEYGTDRTLRPASLAESHLAALVDGGAGVFDRGNTSNGSDRDELCKENL